MLDAKRIGFIGSGMMAEAICSGLIKSGIEPARITMSDPIEERLAFLNEQFGVQTTSDNPAVVDSSDIIILAVKPFDVPEVLSNVDGVFTTEKLLVYICAGVTTASIESKMRADVPVVRVMPNTPCLVGEGATAIAPGSFAECEHLDIVAEIFSAVGKVVRTTEDKLDAVTGLSGSGPAYVYTFIEALADGGVRMGLPRATALLLAAQTVAGSAAMVLQSGEHPAVLRDRVTTPGGTTIEGTAALEAQAFRSAVIDAVTAAAKRSTELGKPKNK